MPEPFLWAPRAFIDGAWKTILVAGLNKGGRGYYALDITQPDPLTTRNNSDGEIEVSRVSRSPVELARRIVVTCIGVALIITGILIIPLPGPWSFPIIIAGLAVLAQEYDWAKDAREWVREKSRAVAKKFKRRND